MDAAPPAAAQEIITLACAQDVPATLDRLTSLLAARGLRVFARIDHSGAAADAGLALRPTQVLVFGHPARGTLLMQARRMIGLDLPIRALAWEDEAGRTWLSYRRVGAIAAGHGLAAESAEITQAIDQHLTRVCAEAAGGTGAAPAG